MKNRTTNGFDKMSIANLIAKARFIVNQVGENATYFPQPNPTLGDLTKFTDDFVAAAEAAGNGDRVAIAYRNELRDILVSNLRHLGSYVNMVANGNLVMLRASGFDVAKTPQPRPAIGFVPVPRLSAGPNAGTLKVELDKVSNATSFQYYIHHDVHAPLSAWRMAPSSTRKITFTGLPGGSRQYVLAAAVGVGSQLVFGEPASYVVQ